MIIATHTCVKIKAERPDGRRPRLRPVRRTGWLLGFCLALVVGPAAAPAGAGLWDALRKTVVLDPGHGGKDTGIRGPGGVLEKDVTLSFARLMESRLKRAYRVVLTRTDDYAVELSMRTATANHEEADLLISIHAAARPNPERPRVDLFCFEAPLPPDTAQDSRPAGGGDSKKRPRQWDRLQLGHRPACDAFAGMLETAVRNATGRPVRRHQAPLSVLKAADMPAVLIEIGYSSQSPAATGRRPPDAMGGLADSVCAAVFEYLK